MELNQLELTLYLLDLTEALHNFFTLGGPILYLISILSFFMWALILERLWYYLNTYPQHRSEIIKRWTKRKEHNSWYAKAIQEKLISEAELKINQNLALIKTLIMLCPLFGLLGTITGMIDVFTVLSASGGSDIRSMAGGVSRATIPTMAGMVIALSGIFANIYLNKEATKERNNLEGYFYNKPAKK